MTTAKSTATKAKTPAKTKASAKAAPKPEQPIGEQVCARTEVLNIEDLDPYDSPTQLPYRYDAETIERYSQLMRDSLWDWSRIESYPVVFKDSEGKYWIGDGHHTLESAHEADLTVIKCLVFDGDMQDAKEYSYSLANRLHGLPITNSQKLQLVINTIKDPAMLTRISIGLCKGTPKDIPSSRAIAKWLGIVSATYVDQIWSRVFFTSGASAADNWPWLGSETRIGLDGKRFKIQPLVAAPLTIIREIVAAAETPTAEPTDREYGEPSMNAHNATIPSATEPAPTNSAPLAPIATYTGKAREHLIRELAKKYASEIATEIAPQMQFKGKISIAHQNIEQAIIDELLNILDS